MIDATYCSWKCWHKHIDVNTGKPICLMDKCVSIGYKGNITWNDLFGKKGEDNNDNIKN